VTLFILGSRLSYSAVIKSSGNTSGQKLCKLISKTNEKYEQLRQSTEGIVEGRDEKGWGGDENG
jgi:hypothetical protein